MPLNPDGSKKGERKNASPVNKPSYNSRKDVTFLDYPLSDAERAHIKAAPLDADRFMDTLDKFLVQGYAVRLVRDDRNACAACQVYAPREGSPNSGYALVGRGSTGLKAIKQFLYITAALDDNWATLDKQSGGGQGYDD